MARVRFAPRKPGQPSVGRRRGGASSPEAQIKVPDGLSSDEEIAELIGSLTGKEVKIGKGPVLQPGPACPVIAATYADEEGNLGALLLADVAAAAGMGAALTLMPAAAVTDAMRAGTLDDALLENWAEIANICTQMVRLPGFPRFQLTGSVQSSDGLPADVEALLARARYRAGWSLQVPQYSNGRMSLILDRADD
jgi:hypothetical protein